MTFAIPERLQRLAVGLCCTVLFALALPARAQFIPAPAPVPGVRVEQDGNVKSRAYAARRQSGRPELGREDLGVAQRTACGRDGRAFGCRIDPDPKSVDIRDDVMKRVAKASRKTRMEEMAKALGPQKVSVFGTPGDSRLAFVLVAADYKLKRFAMGLEPAAAGAPGVGIGHAVDNTRS